MTSQLVLFVDTETTGLLHEADPPHLCELALLLETVAGDEVASYSAMVYPDDWTVPAVAAAVHGLTTERLAACGLPLADVWAAWISFATRASLYVAHNAPFDRGVLELVALDWPGAAETPPHPWYCTMREAAPLCRLPGRTPGGSWRWPSLESAHRHLCGSPVVGSHRAAADVRACRDVYRAIQRGATRSGEAFHG